MKKIIVPIIISALALIFIFSYQTGQLSDKVLTVVFCDVGQGDAVYIRTPGQIDILIDGGRDKKVLDCLADNMPLWDREIELVFATHPDADHIGGLISVMQNYSVKSFNTVSAEKDTKVFETLQNVIAEKKIPYQEITAGSKFTLSDGVVVETLWPKVNLSSRDTNEYSLVQILRFGEFDLLLTGDITYQILNSLAFDSDSIEVFKLPHHGSKTGINDSTLEKIRPSLAIISAGKNNAYHHPHPSVLSLLKKFGIEYKRTDQDGAIRVVTDGRATKVLE
jgi:competence protein ComEC